MSAGVIGVLGAIVGAAAVLLSQWLQSRSEDRRARARLAVEAAVAEYESDRALGMAKGGYMAPLTSYIFWNAEVVRLIEADNLTPDALRDLQARHDELKKVYRVQRRR